MTSQYKLPEEIREELRNFFEQEYGTDILNKSPEMIENLDGSDYRANIVSIIQENKHSLHRMDRIWLSKYISTINDAQKALALTEILASIDIDKVLYYHGGEEDTTLLYKTIITNIEKFGQEAEYAALAKKYMDDSKNKIIQGYVAADSTARQDISDFFNKSLVMPNLMRAVMNKSSRKVIFESKKICDIGFDYDVRTTIYNIINSHFTELFDKDDLSDAQNMLELAYNYSSREKIFRSESFIKQYPELEKIYIETQLTHYDYSGFNSTPLDKLILSAEQIGIPEIALNSISRIRDFQGEQEVKRVLATLDKLTSVKEPQLRTTFLENVNHNFDSIKNFFYLDENNTPVLRKICAEITDLYKNGNLDNINYDILFNSKPKKKFDNFDEFAKWTREFSEKAQAPESFDFEELTESELKSKAILGKFDREDLLLNDFSQENDELRAEALYGALNFLDSETHYENKLWSVEAAKINDPLITQSLIDLIKRKYDFKTGSDAANYDRVFVPEDLLLSWAFNNNQVWKAFEGYLSQTELSPLSVLTALGRTPQIDNKLLPLVKNTLGENFTSTYLEFKELIDFSPRKDLFISKLKGYTNEADFLDAFTINLKEIASEDQFAGNDDWGAIGASLSIDEKGFRQRAEELFLQMLEHREDYITSRPNNHNNTFIRKNFPDLVKLYEDNFSISKEDIIETVRFCHQAKRIKNLIHQEIEQNNEKLKNQDPRLLRDIIDCVPQNMDEVEQLINCFKAMNERPETYGSSYNLYYPEDIYPIIKRSFPEWMVPIVINACLIGVISDERLGGQKDLFDACKTWKINPYIWKKEAVAIGKMPLPMRMIAGGVFAKIQKEIQPDLRPQKPLKKEHRERFWQEMKLAQEMGYERAIQTYVKDSLKNRKRVAGLLFGSRLSSHEEAALIGNVSIKNLSTLKTGAFHKAVNVLLDLEWKNAGYGDRISDIYRQNITEIEAEKIKIDESPLYVKDKNNDVTDLESFYVKDKDG